MAGTEPSPTGSANRRATCATHNLNYDPNQHSGCTLCRRAEKPPPDETAGFSFESLKPMLQPLMGLVLFAAVGVPAFKFMQQRDTEESKCMPDQCFQECPREASGNFVPACANGCLAKLEECVENGSKILNMNIKLQGAVFGDEPASTPAMIALLERVFIEENTAGCMGNRGSTYSRVDVLGTTGKPREAHAIGSPQDAGACVAHRLAEYTYPTHASDYAMYVMFKKKR